MFIFNFHDSKHRDALEVIVEYRNIRGMLKHRKFLKGVCLAEEALKQLNKAKKILKCECFVNKEFIENVVNKMPIPVLKIRSSGFVHTTHASKYIDWDATRWEHHKRTEPESDKDFEKLLRSLQPKYVKRSDRR